MIKAADYSEETSLKDNLLKDIQTLKRMSFKDLGEMLGKNEKPASHERDGRGNARNRSLDRSSTNGVLNNDRAMVPDRTL